MAHNPIKFDKNIVRKYCVELYGKINNSLYHYAKEMKDGMTINDLLKDKKHTYDKHLKMYDMLDQVIDKLDEKTSGDDSGDNSGNSGNGDGNAGDSSKIELTKDTLKTIKFIDDVNFNSFFEKYLRDVIMRCFNYIIENKKSDFNMLVNDYSGYLKLSNEKEFEEFGKKIDTYITDIKKIYINSDIQIITIKILEIIKVLCCYNLYKKFLDIRTSFQDNSDNTPDAEKLNKYIDISKFKYIDNIFDTIILQQFTSWYYDAHVNEMELFNNINEMHKQIVTEDLIKLK
jgi:hypothetical protein